MGTHCYNSKSDLSVRGPIPLNNASGLVPVRELIEPLEVRLASTIVGESLEL
jgi:hypothetical protein